MKSDVFQGTSVQLLVRSRAVVVAGIGKVLAVDVWTSAVLANFRKAFGGCCRSHSVRTHISVVDLVASPAFHFRLALTLTSDLMALPMSPGAVH